MTPATAAASAPTLKALVVRNLRSIEEPVSLTMPSQGALVLLGENNAGKSNILRGLDIVLGDQWPGSRQLEDHDYFGRDGDGIEVSVLAQVSGITCPGCFGDVTHFSWRNDLAGVDGRSAPVLFEYRHVGCHKSWPSNDMRRALGYVAIGADRNLGYQLSYSSKYTMLSKLMHRFHQRLIADGSRKAELVLNFAKLVELFGEVPEFEQFQSALATLSEELGQNLPYRLEIDFSAYDPSNFFRSLRVHPKLEGEVRSFDELGTGQAQILALAFSCAYARAFGQSEGTILAVDEPEAHLHPLAQQWLARQLNAMGEAGLQVIVTTHSPHFVDLARPENLVLVRKPLGATTATQLSPAALVDSLIAKGADAARTTVAGVGPFYAAAATEELVSGLFARRCVLVEGPTEAAALPALLHLAGLDTLKEGVAVVSVGGLGNLAKWYRLFTAWAIPCFVVFDTDARLTGKDKAKVQAQREDLFNALGLPTELADADAMSKQALFVADRYASLSPTFEPAMVELLGDAWLTVYEESADVVGESAKPLRARYTAERMDLASASHDALAALGALADAIAPRADDGSLGPDVPTTASHEEADSVWDDEPPF